MRTLSEEVLLVRRGLRGHGVLRDGLHHVRADGLQRQLLLRRGPLRGLGGHFVLRAVAAVNEK